MNSEDNRDPYDYSQSPYQSPIPEPNESSDPIHAQYAEMPPARQKLTFSGMLAWGLVIAMTAGICGLVISSQLFLEAPVEGNTTAMELMPIQIQVKALVGQKNLVEDGPPVQIPPELDSGPYEQRLCYSILLNELESSTSALDHIEETDSKVENVDLKLTDEQKRLGDIVTDLMESYEDGDHDSSSISVEDRDFLKERLRWVGELALYPADSPHTAERTKVISEARGLMIGGIIFMLLGFLIGFGGFVLALVFGVMLFAGKLTPHFKNHLTNHNIYICLLYTSPSPRDRTRSRMPSSA